MTKAEARRWLRRIRLDAREFEALLDRRGSEWLDASGPGYELLNDLIGSAAAIQSAQEEAELRAADDDFGGTSFGL